MKDKQTSVSVEDLEALIQYKRNEIKKLRKGLAQSILSLARAKKKRGDDEKKERLENIASNFDGLWKELVVIGFNYNEIISLQNIDAKYRVLGDMLGVSPARARQVREMARRKASRSGAKEIATKLGLSHVLVEYDKKPKAEKYEPDEEMLKARVHERTLRRLNFECSIGMYLGKDQIEKFTGILNA